MESTIGFIRNELPLLNSRIATGQVEISQHVVSILPYIEKVITAAKQTRFSREQARECHKLLCFLVIPIEKGFQAMGFPPGYGLAQLPGVKEALALLSKVGETPIWMTHYDYWVWNNSTDPLLITGNRQEAYFNSCVNLVDRLHKQTADTVRPICDGSVSLDSTKAIEALRSATAYQLRVWDEGYRKFMATDASTGERNMTPLFFAMEMRVNLVGTVIDGDKFTGPNAAYISSQPQVDFLIGTTDEKYDHIVRERFRYQTPEDLKMLKADMGLPSLASLATAQLNLSYGEVEACSSDELAFRLRALSPKLTDFLSAYCGLCEAAAHATAMHWSLIHSFLIKEAEKLTQEQIRMMTVKPSQGTGDKAHSDTKGIMEMRTKHPVVGKLVAAIHLLRRPSAA